MVGLDGGDAVKRTFVGSLAIATCLWLTCFSSGWAWWYNTYFLGAQDSARPAPLRYREPEVAPPTEEEKRARVVEQRAKRKRQALIEDFKRRLKARDVVDTNEFNREAPYRVVVSMDQETADAILAEGWAP